MIKKSANNALKNADRNFLLLNNFFKICLFCKNHNLINNEILKCLIKNVTDK